jgi:hypothetical protein
MPSWRSRPTIPSPRRASRSATWPAAAAPRELASNVAAIATRATKLTPPTSAAVCSCGVTASPARARATTPTIGSSSLEAASHRFVRKV